MQERLCKLRSWMPHEGPWPSACLIPPWLLIFVSMLKSLGKKTKRCWRQGYQLNFFLGNQWIECELQESKVQRQPLGAGSHYRNSQDHESHWGTSCTSYYWSATWGSGAELGDAAQLLDLHMREMEVQWSNARSHMTYMQDFTAALAQWFSTSSSMYMAFPPPPVWPLQHMDIDHHDDAYMGGNVSDNSWYYKRYLSSSVLFLDKHALGTMHVSKDGRGG